MSNAETGGAKVGKNLRCVAPKGIKQLGKAEWHKISMNTTN